MSIRSKPVRVVATAAAFLLVTAGCGSTLDEQDSVEELSIGVPVPLSGPTAETGKAYSNGVALAAKQAVAEEPLEIDGEEAEVKVTECDTEGTPTGGTNCASRLASQEKVIAQLATFSSEAIPMMAINEDEKAPFILTATSSADKFTRSGNKLVARFWNDPKTYMPQFAKSLFKAGSKDGLQDVAVMATADEFGETYTAEFERNWTDLGGSVVAKATFKNEATDFYPQLSSIMKKKPDAISIPTVCSAAAPIVTQARELGYKGDFIMITPCQPEALTDIVPAKDVVGSYFEGTPLSLDSEGAQKFKQSYEKEFGSQPDPAAASGYIAARVIIEAARIADNVADPYEIRSSMPAALEKADDQGWNYLGFSELTDEGNTTADIHVRRQVKPDQVRDYTN